MTCHFNHGWVCEAHLDQPWPHGDCPGPGTLECRNPACPYRAVDDLTELRVRLLRDVIAEMRAGEYSYGKHGNQPLFSHHQVAMWAQRIDAILPKRT